MMINLKRKSPYTGKVNSMDLATTKEALDEYYSGSVRYVQDIFSNLNAEEREFIMTGYTPNDWYEIFAEED